MNLYDLSILTAGLVLLVGGAEILVRGASRIAGLAGISPLVVGLTVVSLGTSSPEIAVSLQSGLAGQGDLALGNIVGSNICNILLILGLAAMISPLYVSQKLIRLDVPVMIGISVLVLFFGLDGSVMRIEAIVLLAGALGYVGFLLAQSRREGKEILEQYAEEFSAPPDHSARTWMISVGLAVAGLALLVLGSRWLVSSAVSVAQAFGVSELVIGLTIVAVGTSLPEVATSVMASIKGEWDIAVGNAVGSNIFNILVVLGLAGAVTPGGIPVAPAAISFDIPVMIVVAIACLPVFATGNRIARWEGFVFLGYYAAYTVYIVLDNTGHDALPIYSTVMIAFVIPLTVVTLALVAWRHFRGKQLVAEQ